MTSVNTINSVSLVSSYDELLFPKTITEYRTTLMFDSEEAKQQLIAIVAERVSSLYATFLTSEGHQQKSEELSFNMDPSIFPSCQAVEKFKDNLKNKMIKILNEGNEDSDTVKLSTDYGPETLLAEVLDESEISWNDFEVWNLFPIKTSTRICKWNKFKKIDIRINP